MSKLIVCLTNKSYLMASSGYKFQPIKDLEVQINLPSWIKPSGMVHITPTGIQSVPHRYKEGKLVISVDPFNDAAIIVAPNAQNAEDVYQARLRSILSDEDRDFSKGMCALVECRMQRHAQLEIQSSEEVMPLAIGEDVDEVLHIDVAEASLPAPEWKAMNQHGTSKSLQEKETRAKPRGISFAKRKYCLQGHELETAIPVRSHPSGESLLHENAALGIDCHVYLACSITLGNVCNDCK